MQVERLGRMRVVERFTAVVARLRLGPQVCAGWPGGVGRQGAMPGLVAAVLWRLAGCDARGPEPQAHPPLQRTR